jgi:hypothetical protein
MLTIEYLLFSNYVSDDPMDRVCHVLCQLIEQDWMNVYRNLPFIPTRGSHVIEQDISAMNLQGSRGDPIEDIAARALSRWRRYHTRAKATDIVEALRNIKRLDVLKEVDLVLHPPPEVPEPVEVIPSYITPELVPYWRMGERFDQLRSENRLQLVNTKLSTIY